MQHHLSPRSQATLDRIDAWAACGLTQRLVVGVGVSIVGPLAVLAGVAMLVLPGPGLVVVALGLALLALEYEWARRVLGGMGGLLAWIKAGLFPTGATPQRRFVGVAAAGAFVAVTTALTAGISTYVGAQAIL